MNARLLLLTSATALLAAPLSAQAAHYARQPGIDVQNYAFGVTLTDASDEIAGETTVTVRFTQDGLPDFFLDLASAADGKGMTVTNVTSDSGAVRFTHTNDRLIIALARSSPKVVA